MQSAISKETLKTPLLSGVRTRVELSATYLTLAASLLVGALLRLLFIGEKSIWLDEAFSIAISQRAPIETLRMVVLTDAHPPLYYLLLNRWMALGSGEAWVRLLSFFFSTAAILMAYKVGQALYRDQRAGLVAAGLLSLSPFHIWYAQEARMYAMLTFFVLVSAYFFVQGVRRGSPFDWLGYVLGTALALYTDNGAIWYVLATTLCFIWSRDLLPRRTFAWISSQLVIAGIYAPWLPSLWSQTTRVAQGFWLPAPSFHTVLGTLADFTSFNFPWLAPVVIYLAAILVLAYIVPAPNDWRRRLVTLWMVAPLVASLLISLRQPVFLSRNLIAASLGLYFLITGTLIRFEGAKPIALLLAPLLLMNLYSVGHNTWSEPKEDWRTAASLVSKQIAAREAGLVVFIPPYAELPFDYYFPGYGLQVETQGYPENEMLLHEQPRQVSDPGSLLSGRPYVWLVLRDVEAADPQGLVKGWLDRHGYVRTRGFTDGEIRVISYVRWDLFKSSKTVPSRHGGQVTPRTACPSGTAPFRECAPKEYKSLHSYSRGRMRLASIAGPLEKITPRQDAAILHAAALLNKLNPLSVYGREEYLTP